MPLYYFANPLNGSADSDLMLGPDGATTTITGNGGNDVILGDLSSLVTWTAPNSGIGSARTLAGFGFLTDENPLFANPTVPHLLLINTTTIGQAEYYSVALTAGQTITVDIDFGGDAAFIDTVVEIRNSADTILASDDDSLLTDGGYGSFSTSDPFLNFTAPGNDTYYISIHPAVASTFSSVYTFTINFSVTGHSSSPGSFAGDDVISGGDGNDQLLGVGGVDQLNGDAGSDQLDGGSGNDILRGGADNDALFGGSGNDTLDGGSGNDVLNGGVGVDVALYAAATSAVTVNLAVVAPQNTLGAGLDTLTAIENVTGSTFADTLTGNAGANALNGHLGSDVLRGGGGNDNLIGSEGNDTLDGGLGNDSLNGGNGLDVAYYATASSAVTVNLGLVAAQNTLGAGLDTLTAVENLIGSTFADTLRGNTGANSLNGYLGNDVLYGFAGNDSLIGGEGNDAMDGGAGNDVLNGGNGSDGASYVTATAQVVVNLGIVAGQNTLGSGIDTLTAVENLSGSGFGDVLTGNAGGNVISGGGGNDTVNGRGGNDTLIGGAGNDWFQFDTPLGAATNVDIITDFVVADDSFLLSHAIFTGIGGSVVSAAEFQLGTAANDAGDRIIYDSATGRIYYDADGNGPAAQVLFARVTAGTALTNEDFLAPLAEAEAPKAADGPIAGGMPFDRAEIATSASGGGIGPYHASDYFFA